MNKRIRALIVINNYDATKISNSGPLPWTGSRRWLHIKATTYKKYT